MAASVVGRLWSGASGRPPEPIEDAPLLSREEVEDYQLDSISVAFAPAAAPHVPRGRGGQQDTQHWRAAASCVAPPLPPARLRVTASVPR